MKFSSLYILPALALSTLVSAGVFISPTPGQTISSTEAFNLTWTSGKYFKENSLNITVLLARSTFTSTLSGITLVEGLVSSDAGIKTYSAELAPRYFYGDNETGAFDVVIIESYAAYGGANDATDVWIQTVNVA
ncbi:uncharacterized protein EV420DRAFT_1478659 [Desarmillaria tabescens]|uniref:Uncharacterized protein n=1 Tax=Armillaria tabescens TaxID=1929756 RepID=A0AA39N7B4_ARMTA|nr:uncharacterized protein EV420DRAFT_1478659 [Desarmillaria tabescens]KAK0460130.1 hypothetical protein EV420DRAFT_1478659 [Desarmillaria tabescens]